MISLRRRIGHAIGQKQFRGRAKRRRAIIQPGTNLAFSGAKLRLGHGMDGRFMKIVSSLAFARRVATVTADGNRSSKSPPPPPPPPKPMSPIQNSSTERETHSQEKQGKAGGHDSAGIGSVVSFLLNPENGSVSISNPLLSRKELRQPASSASPRIPRAEARTRRRRSIPSQIEAYTSLEPNAIATQLRCGNEK